ncbi:Uncharacterised protein [Candidatus Bilamarchaeum dharawalense]|uniref:Uncharacterized protein n=1 Tax=Candidatus Bilamarchaeum dharawalense TaxID=2885759 RepID=A0A5E4LSH5_9ARCH|nr:Uncharacterised protein [Candidatus Bilamarchaeum dharawalense]
MRNEKGMTMSDERVTFPAVEANVPVAAALSEAQKIKKGICPSCDGNLVFQEGCKVCYSCGWGGCE